MLAAESKTSWLDTLIGFADKGADVYNKIQQGRDLASGNGNTGAGNTGVVPPRTNAPTGTAPIPFYKQAWFLPVAIVAGVLVLGFALFAGRGRNKDK